MSAITAVTLALLASASAPPARVLLCLPRVIGEVDRMRRGAVAFAVRDIPGRFLDYGVVCEGIPEAARAARRAGLDQALFSSVEQKGQTVEYVLSLSDAALEREIGRRSVSIAPGEDAVRPVRRALRELVSARWPSEFGAWK
jgi:hypothetical protein